jgi:hypothetical protein
MRPKKGATERSQWYEWHDKISLFAWRGHLYSCAPVYGADEKETYRYDAGQDVWRAVTSEQHSDGEYGAAFWTALSWSMPEEVMWSAYAKSFADVQVRVSAVNAWCRSERDRLAATSSK